MSAAGWVWAVAFYAGLMVALVLTTHLLFDRANSHALWARRWLRVQERLARDRVRQSHYDRGTPAEPGVQAAINGNRRLLLEEAEEAARYARKYATLPWPVAFLRPLLRRLIVAAHGGRDQAELFDGLTLDSELDEK